MLIGWVWAPGLVALEHQVGGLDEFSHDGGGDELGGLAVVKQAICEGFQAGVAAFGGEGGEVDETAGPAPSAADETLALEGSAVGS